MDTDAWQSTRTRVARLFGRGRPIRQARYEAQLDDNATQVAQADHPDDVRESLVAVWRLELQALLHRHPDAAEELRALVVAVQPALPAAQQAWVRTYLAQQQSNH
jgi:hypothetical protein